MKIISTQMKVTLTSSTVKPAALLICGNIDVKSISKQMRESSLPSTGKPVAELEEKHIFGRLDAKNIKKQMKINHTSSTWKPVPNAEFKEYPTQQSNKQEDKIRRQLIGNLVHQIQNHPNKDALVADLQQNQSYNLFSEKPKEMINNMGNMEYIEMCEIYPKIQCTFALRLP